MTQKVCSCPKMTNLRGGWRSNLTKCHLTLPARSAGLDRKYFIQKNYFGHEKRSTSQRIEVKQQPRTVKQRIGTMKQFRKLVYIDFVLLNYRDIFFSIIFSKWPLWDAVFHENDSIFLKMFV